MKLVLKVGDRGERGKGRGKRGEGRVRWRGTNRFYGLSFIVRKMVQELY